MRRFSLIKGLYYWPGFLIASLTAFTGLLMPVSFAATSEAAPTLSKAETSKVRARTTLLRGSVLTMDDLDVGSMSAEDARVHVRPLLGQAVRRTIYAGAAISPAHVVPPQIVKRNSRVKMIYRAGPMELTAWGRALEGGAAGDRVFVINLESRKKVQGHILASGEVEVGP